MPSTLYSAGQNTGVVYKHSGVTSTVAAIISTPHLSNLTGITIYRDTTLISANSGSDKIFVHSGVSSTITSSFSSPSTNPTGLAVAASLDLVSSDSSSDKIYVHVGTSGVIQSSFAAPGSFIAGLAIGAGGPSGRLLSSDASSRKIFYHDGISSSIISSFSSPGQGPAGLALDGSGNLVSANQRVPDGEPDRIYIHSGISATITSSFNPPSGVTPSGLYIVTSVLSSSYTKSSAKLVVPGVTAVVVYINSATTVQPIGSTIAYAFAKSGAKISTIQYDEDLISTDEGTDRIYVHSGMSAAITSSFSAPNFGQYSVGDLAIVEGAGDLVSTWPYGSTVYIHSGRSAQVRTVIQMPWSVVGGTRLEGAEVLPNGNLITADPLQDIIRVHAGISENVLSTFTPPGAYCAALSVATNGDLVSVDKTSNMVYIHFGVSSAIRSSFAAPGSGSVYGVAVDAAGSIMTVKTLEGGGSGKIYIHSGTASEVTSSFQSPSSYPRGIVSAPRVTSVYGFVKSSAAVSGPEAPRQHIRCSASLLVVSLEFLSFVGSSCGLAAAGISMLSFATSSCALTAESASLASFVRASCGVVAPGANLFSFVPGNASLIVPPPAYFLYTALGFPPKIFIRSEMSSTILDSFSLDAARSHLAVDLSGNLIAAGAYDQGVYVHPRAIGQQISSFATPFNGGADGVDVDEGGNLITGSRNYLRFYVSQGISNTVTASFSGGDYLNSLAVSENGSLISSHDFPVREIRLHSGISATVAATLSRPEPESYALDMAVDQSGNLLWWASNSGKIYKHSGTTSTVSSVLYMPGNWLGLTTSTFDMIRIDHTKSVGDIASEESDYVASSTTVGEAEFITSTSSLQSPEYLKSVVNVVLSALDHVKSSTTMADASFVISNAALQSDAAFAYVSSRTLLHRADSNALITTDHAGSRIRIHVGVGGLLNNSFASPESSPFGLAWNTSDLISGYRYSNKIYVHSGVTSTITSSFSAPDTGGPLGLTVDTSGNLLSMNDDGAFGDKVYVHSGVTSAITSSFGTPANSPTGLAIDGTGNLISADYFFAKKIYRHSGISAVVTSSFNYPYSNPKDITLDDSGNLVVSDYSDNRIYQFSGVSATLRSSFSAQSAWGATMAIPPPIEFASCSCVIRGANFVTVGRSLFIQVRESSLYAVTSSFAVPEVFARGVSMDLAGNLISANNDVRVYLHSGITSTISSSFTHPSTSTLQDVSITSAGNLLSTEHSVSTKVWIHSGISATISSSFSGPAANCFLTVDFSGNLLSQSFTGSGKIYTHSGITGTITSSFTPTNGANLRGITLDEGGNLVSVLYISGGGGLIYAHLGVSATISSSFSADDWTSGAAMDFSGVIWNSSISHVKSLCHLNAEIQEVNSSTELMLASVEFSLSSANISAVSGDYFSSIVSSSTIKVVAGDYVDSLPTVSVEAVDHEGASVLLTASVLEGVMSASALIADTGIEYFSSAPNVQYGVFEYLPSSSVVQVEVMGSISSAANVQTGVTEFVASAPTLNASSREHLLSAVNLLGRPEFVLSLVSVIAEDLVSSNDVPGALIYVHSGISSAVLSSFTSPVGATTKGLALDSRGNLLVADADPAGGKIFTLLGISAIVRSSFSPPFAGRPTGLTVDPWDNLIGQFGANTIGVFVGMSSQVDRSFVAAATGDIAIDRNGNLITTSTDFQNIYTYAGISSTVVSSFSSPSNAPSGIVVDQDNNIISSDYGTQIIFVHSGISQTVTVTFEAPSASQRGLTTTIPPSTSPAVYIQCETDVLGTPPEFDYLSSACVVVIRAASYVSSSCEIGQQSFSYAEALCQVDVELLAHLKSATTLNIRTSGGLVSSDLTTRKIYVHKGISEVILSSFLFSGSRPNGIGVLQSGDIIACDVDGPAVYVHSGLTSTVSSSFALPYLAPAGAALDPAENLAICSQSTKLIYLHSGATSTVVSSFPAPDTSGGGAIPTGLGQTPSGNLVSLVTSGHLWGNQSKLSIHSGFSATITTSFENAWESASLLLTGVDADDFGNVLSCDVVTQSIRVHDGLTSIVAVSFASPGPEPSGLGIRAAQTVSNYVASSSVIAVISVENIIVSALLKAAEQEWLSSSAELSADDISFIAGSALANTSATPEHVISASTLEAEAREYEGSGCHLVIGSIAPEGFLSGSALLLAVEVSFASSNAWLNAAGIAEYISSSTLVQIASQEYAACTSTLLALDTSFILSEAILSVPGDLEHVVSESVVRAAEYEYLPSTADVAAVYTARDYCRDARDFRGMLGSYSGGRGYGYDADASQWSGSGGHGADYTSARHLTAAGAAGANIQNTQFNDSYVNRENFAPANRIQGFVSGSYFIWLYVNGGTANNAHGVTIGANPEVTTASGNGTWQWKLIGNYYVDQTTTIQFRFTNIDGYLHAIRTICLMDQPGAPTDAPTGAEGDKSSSFSFGLQEVKSAATLAVGAVDHVKDSVRLQVDVTSFVQASAGLAVRDYTKSLADLDGQSRQEFANSITAVADQDAEYCSGEAALNGALQADYISGGASVHIAQRSHIKSAAALDGEAFHSFARSSAAILTFVEEFVDCQVSLSTSPLQDSFSVLLGGRFFLGDTFSIVRESTDSFLLDTFSVAETAEFASGFADDFRVMSEATQQVLNADVQIITVEVS